LKRRQQENYNFGGMARESVMEQESGKVGDAKFEPFQFKSEDLILCAMRNRQRLEKKLTEKQSISKIKSQSFSSRPIQNEKKMFHSNCQISAYVFP